MAAQQKNANLQQIQLLKNQAAAGSGQLLIAAGRVDAAHGVRLGGHTVAGQQLRRQRVGQLVGKGQRCMGTRRVAAGGQALGAGVDRHKRAGGHLGLGAHQRMQQLAPGQRPADAALKIVALPYLQLIRRVRGVEPAQRQNPRIVGGEDTVHNPPALDAPGRLLLQHGGADAAVSVIGG